MERHERIVIRLSTQEKKRIQESAVKMGVPVSTYIRLVALKTMGD